jgi:sugar lactone lactonase YvrE
MSGVGGRTGKPSLALVTATLAVLVMAVTACGEGAADRTGSPGATRSPTFPAVTGVLRTVAGGGNEVREGAPALSARLCEPTDVAVDGKGNIYIAEPCGFGSSPRASTIRKVDPEGNITTVAGTGTAGFSGDGGPATEAELNHPGSIAVDQEGNLYISDFGNHRIRKVDARGIIDTVAGTGDPGWSGENGPARKAHLFNAEFGGGLALDAQGNLYVADQAFVWRIDPSGTISIVAGSGQGGHVGDGGPATAATLRGALDVAVDLEGNLYISEWDGQRVRKVDPNGTITTIAGNGQKSPPENGVPATSSGTFDPWGIAVDAAGNVFIVQHHGSIVQKIDRDGVLTTVVGIFLSTAFGQGKFNGDEGPATKMRLNEPGGLFVDEAGVLYIADTFNDRVREVRFDTP